MRHVVQISFTVAALCLSLAAAAAQPPVTAVTSSGGQPRALSFMGRRYFLYHTQKKGIGVTTWYSPSRSYPTKSREILMLNYTLRHGAHHSPVTAAQIATTMVKTFRALHAPWLFPFAVPDHKWPGHYIYFVNAVLFLPAARETSLVMARIHARRGGKWIVGVIFQRTRHGHWSGSTKMTQVTSPDLLWLKAHLRKVSKALTSVRAPLPPPLLR